MTVYAYLQTEPKAGYLTARKLYQVLDDNGSFFKIIDNDGDVILCNWKDCAHLDGGSWTRIKKPGVLERIKALCEDGERSDADRLDDIYRLVTEAG